MQPKMSQAEPSWIAPGPNATPEIPGADAFCETSLLDVLTRAVERDPEAIALTDPNGGMSYAALLRLALNAARAVTERTRPTDPVALLTRRCPDHVAALLGCLIAGRTCLVIDAFDPIERREILLADARPALVLADAAAGLAYPLLSFNEVLAFNEAISADGPAGRWQPDQVWDADRPCAVHFTSGSTGRPKGIVLSARSVLYRALQVIDTFALTPADRMWHTTVPLTSTGTAAVLAVLVSGGRVIVSDLAREGVNATLNLLEREAVTFGSTPPAVLHALLSARRADAAFRHLRKLRLGSSAVARAELAAFRAALPPECEMYFSYASTEALTISTWRVPADDDGDELNLPSGFLHFCHDYALLDENGHSVAADEAGELMIRSRYVALGEWRDGRVTEGRMIPVPGRPGWRTFRTGDVVRIGPDGMLRVIGRTDRQVKINGMLVHPAEIETVLKAEPGVIDAAVVACPTRSGDTLHGFIAVADPADATLAPVLRARLRTALPGPLRPATLTVLEELPRLPSGKVDLIKLREMARG